MSNPFRRPMVPICLAYLLGLTAFAVSEWPIRLAVLAVFLALTAFMALRSGTTALLIAAIAVFGTVRYAAYVQRRPDDISNFASGKQVRITGVVAADSDIVGRRLTTIVRVSRLEKNGGQFPASGRIWTRFYLPKRPSTEDDLPDYGDVISFNCFLRRPIEFGNPGSFSWPKYLERQRIFATAYSRWDKADIECSHIAGGGPLSRAAHALRHKLLYLIEKRYPRAEAGTVAGILLGIATDLSPADRIAFSRTGTYHLLAASGFNCLVIIIVFGRYLFPWLRLHKRRSHLLLVCMLILYAMISGGRPSIVRAAIMAGLYLLAFVMNRVEDPINILATAALVILIARPTDFFDVGFRLSFAAAASIIIIAPILKSWRESRPAKIKDWHKYLYYPGQETLEAAIATTAVTLGTAPLIAESFNQFSLVSIPANAMVAFLALLVFITTTLSLAFGWIPIIGDAVNLLGIFVVRVMLWIVRTLGSWEYALASVRSIGTVALAGYYLLLGVGVWYASDRLTSRKR